MARCTVNSGPRAAASARPCACVPSTSGDPPPMSAYFSAEEGARKRVTSFAKSLRNGPNGAETTSGSEKSS